MYSSIKLDSYVEALFSEFHIYYVTLFQAPSHSTGLVASLFYLSIKDFSSYIMVMSVWKNTNAAL